MHQMGCSCDSCLQDLEHWNNYIPHRFRDPLNPNKEFYTPEVYEDNKSYGDYTKEELAQLNEEVKSPLDNTYIKFTRGEVANVDFKLGQAIPHIPFEDETVIIKESKKQMTKAEYFEFHKQCTEKMTAITKAKNADYTGSGDDPFANFSRVEALGICSTEQGFLTRMTDKLSRINSFAQKGELLVKDESVEDTLLDLANYSILLAGYIRSKK